ncbi:MAG: GNAT family N-acetyltransferase [Bdellovibrionales bacterium]
MKTALVNLPGSTRNRMIRNMLDLKSLLPDEYSFEIATSEKDFTQAANLIYRCYRETGITESKSNPYRLNYRLSLPTTKLLVAKYKGDVVGCVSLIPNYNLKLASEKLFQDNFNLPEQLICEISTYAVEREHRGIISLHLLKYLLRITLDVLKVESFIITVTKESYASDLMYKPILLFNDLSQELGSGAYDDANGVECVCLSLETMNYHTLSKYVYGDKPKNKNLYHFFYEVPPKNMEIPKNKVSNDLLPFSVVEKVFHELADSFAEMNLQDKMEYIAFYRGTPEEEKFKALLGIESIFSLQKRVASRKCQVDPVILVNDANEFVLGRSIDISTTGLQIYLEENRILDQKMYKIIFLSSEGKIQQAEVEVAWIKGKNIGLQFSRESKKEVNMKRNSTGVA